MNKIFMIKLGIIVCISLLISACNHQNSKSESKKTQFNKQQFVERVVQSTESLGLPYEVDRATLLTDISYEKLNNEQFIINQNYQLTVPREMLSRLYDKDVQQQFKAETIENSCRGLVNNYQSSGMTKDRFIQILSQTNGITMNWNYYYDDKKIFTISSHFYDCISYWR